MKSYKEFRLQQIRKEMMSEFTNSESPAAQLDHGEQPQIQPSDYFGGMRFPPNNRSRLAHKRRLHRSPHITGKAI